MKNQIPSLRIGLLDNSYHSLNRGYEMWSQWQKSQDAWLLKESIIWVHHGIELALKQLLVQTNEFLVFEDINKAVERLGILRRKKETENAGVLDLFEHDDKVTSVGFRNLIERVSIALAINELSENKPLRLKIDELTRYRNKIVHFSVLLDIIKVSSLLSDILDPLFLLLEREVKDDTFVTKYLPDIRRKAQPLQQFNRIAALVQQFNGQVIPGYLLGLGNECTLPKFDQNTRLSGSEDNEADISVFDLSEPWNVQIKYNPTPVDIERIAIQHQYRKASMEGITDFNFHPKTWLIVMGEIPSQSRDILKEHQVMFSSIEEIGEIEKILFPST